MEVLDLVSEFSTIKKIIPTKSDKRLYFDTYGAHQLSHENFFIEHMIKNVPCIIQSITNHWGGLKWMINNKPNFEYLTTMFGKASVPVADCGDRYYNAQKKEEQTLQQYLEYWKKYISTNYPADIPCFYLKDWHFTRDFPEENIYRVPNLFASDWLNEYFSKREDVHDDYRFVYMGPKGSWTPLHADVFSSFSWSVNICGKKRWVLYPPGEEKYLRDKYGNLAYDIESPSLKDTTVFKDYDKLESSFEVIQNPGEAIFVPSGWYHQVWNLDDTISINHNWVNGCNIEKMWISLKDNLAAVKSEISDCQDMENWTEHCQVMLNATYGLNYKQFCQFILFIVRVRLKHLRDGTYLEVYGNWLMGTNHLKFDIMQARDILNQILSDLDFEKLNYFAEAEGEIRNSLEEINSILDRK